MEVTIEFCDLVFAKFCVYGWIFAGAVLQKFQSVYTQQSAQVGIQREKISFGTRFCGTQSLVCYTFVPSTVKKMAVALHDSRLFIGAEQTDKFRQKQKKFVFSDCSEKEQTVYMNPRRSGRKTFESTTQKLRVCSQNKTLSN